METALLVLLILNAILIVVNIVIGLLVGSVTVQIMEVLRRLPEEMRNPKKKEGPPDRPWYTYL